MRQWEIYQWDFPHGAHPAVVFSPDDRCAHGESVNVFACSSQRATRSARVVEVILDESDGLDWPTLCRLDVIWLAPKNELKRRRGLVSVERQRHMRAELIRIFGLLA